MDLANVLVYVVGYYRLDVGLSTPKELVEAVDVGLMLHVKPMLVISYHIYF